MTTSTTRRTKRHNCFCVKMISCYFLATAASSTMRRTIRKNALPFIEAFVPYQTNTKNYGRRSQKYDLSSDSPTIASSFSTSALFSTKETQQQRIPRVEKVRMDNPPPLLNLHTITLEELEELVVAWGYPKFRSKQIYGWIREKGVTNPNDMNNLPKDLRQTMIQFSSRSTGASDDEENSSFDAEGGGALSLAFEAISKDGTRKRAYELRDGQLIESVLMGPYEDGRYTACISSQAGCAMGCVFCATGQMGFARQLSSDEIFEQVSRFSSELKRENDPSKRLSNIVFMGMGEPLANYRNVVKAVNRINSELGIGARKITVSTVGVVPSIKKLYAAETEMPQVRLAVSLHCADDQERTKLLPANERYGGLDELMTTLREYIDTTGRRVTLEWALIAHQNDGVDTARQLGNLIKRYGLRRDMVHVNVIPLNPTEGFGGAKPSNIKRVNAFCDCLSKDFGITATPRVRRGIDIDAGCGQLKAKIQKREEKNKLKQQEEKESLREQDEAMILSDFLPQQQESSPLIGVYVDEDEDDESEQSTSKPQQLQHGDVVEFTVAADAVDFENDDFEDPEYEEGSHDMAEAMRLVSLVEKGAFATKSTQPKATVQDEDKYEKPVKGPTTTIVDEDAVRKAKKKRKKLLRNLKQIKNLKDMKASGEITAFSREQLEKIEKEDAWRIEVEDLEHNLKS